jgi:hypothetical protein
VASGIAEAGTCGALRTQAIAVIDGQETITIEHVNRLAPDLGLEWGEARRTRCTGFESRASQTSPAT